MSEPKCPQNSPYGVELEAESHYWCSCGESNNQPFCDGSHKGSEFTPVKFETTEPKMYYLCGCKKTSTPPYCDGTHKKLTPPAEPKSKPSGCGCGCGCS